MTAKAENDQLPPASSASIEAESAVNPVVTDSADSLLNIDEESSESHLLTLTVTAVIACSKGLYYDISIPVGSFNA